MKHIVLMGPDKPDYVFGDRYLISTFNPLKYLESFDVRYTSNTDLIWRNSKYSPRTLDFFGWNKQKISKRSQVYQQMLSDFFEKYSTVDIIVANWFNPFHPEWLIKAFPHTVKIYGCIDDPLVIYERRVNCLWAFDAAFYISPSYDNGLSMVEALQLWSVSQTYWWPLTSNKVSPQHCQQINCNWNNRTSGVIYVGGLYGPKLDRLAQLKQRLGKDFSIYGRWPLAGYAGFLSPLIGRNWLPYRVPTITEEERRQLYLRHKIGINMHFSECRETGNMRMYEVPFYGLMLLCNKAADGWHESIYKPDIEAVFYDDIEDAVDKAKYYLKHDSEREKIARAGFERACKDYDADKCLKDFLNWASSVTIRKRLCNDSQKN